MIQDNVRRAMNELGGWIDAEESGLAYDEATTFCEDCPHNMRAEELGIIRAGSCCKEEEDYHLKEWETIRLARVALTALSELYRELSGESVYPGEEEL